MTAKQITAAVGIFEDARAAQQAVRALKQAGFRDDEIGVLSPHKEGEHTEGTHAADGALVGVAAGAGAGAAWALGMAVGVLPGIGPAVVGGLLGSVLASAFAGAAVAGVAGALIGLGIPEEEAHYYEGEFKAGRTIVTVQAIGRALEAWSILQQNAAYNRHADRRQPAAAR
jgi:hypothetical protein